MVGNVGESWFRVVVADAGLFSVENESFVSHGAEVMPVYLPEWHVGNTGGYYFYPIVFPLLLLMRATVLLAVVRAWSAASRRWRTLVFSKGVMLGRFTQCFS